MGNLSIGPSASLEYHRISTQGFTETGAGLYNVTMDGFTTDVFSGMLALKGSYDIPTSRGKVTLYGHAGYAMMQSSNLAVPFQFSPVLTGTTYADGASNGWIDIGAGITADLSDMASVGVEYRGALLGGGYSRHTVRAGISIRF